MGPLKYMSLDSEIIRPKAWEKEKKNECVWISSVNECAIVFCLFFSRARLIFAVDPYILKETMPKYKAELYRHF